MRLLSVRRVDGGGGTVARQSASQRAGHQLHDDQFMPLRDLSANKARHCAGEQPGRQLSVNRELALSRRGGCLLCDLGQSVEPRHGLQHAQDRGDGESFAGAGSGATVGCSRERMQRGQWPRSPHRRPNSVLRGLGAGGFNVARAARHRTQTARQRVANALFSATGVRLRSMPLMRQGFTLADAV